MPYPKQKPAARKVAHEFRGAETSLRALLGQKWASRIAKTRLHSGQEALLC